MLTGLLVAISAVTAGWLAAQPGDPAEIRLKVTDSGRWSSKKFSGETAYTTEQNEGMSCVRAESSNSASGRYHPLELSAKEYPLINWSWKVRRTITAENPYEKTGDDFVARIYVIFPGRFFWQKRAIAYVWSDKLPSGTTIPSPYTERVALIAVETGNRFAGIWRQEIRNYVADYRSYFHEEPANPVAIAYMTDTDNTGSRATAWYGDILFSKQQ
jgi:hypothetical protein